jgi:hypothetical protein
MQQLLNVLLGVVFTVLIVLFVDWRRMRAVISQHKVEVEAINTNLANIFSRLNNIHTAPAHVTQNVIHLGLKDARTTTDLELVKLAIRPEDFQVNADRLYELCWGVYQKLAASYPDDSNTVTANILCDSGLNNILDLDGRSSFRNALGRLFINKDTDAVQRFLRTVADSVAAATDPALAA